MTAQQERTQSTPDIFSVADGRIQISPSEGYIHCDGVPLLGVRPKQREVLTALASTPDTLITPEELTHRLYGYSDMPSIQSMRVHLSTSRAMLGPELGNPRTGAFRVAPRAGYFAVSSLDFNIHDFNSEDPSVIKLADSRIEVKADEKKVKIDGEAVKNIAGPKLAILVYLALKHDQYVAGEVIRQVVQSEANIACSSTPALLMQIANLRKFLGPELGHYQQGAIRNKRFVGYTAVTNLAD